MSDALRLPPAAVQRLRPALAVAGVVVLVVLGLLGFARGGDVRPFIYGQF